MTKVPPALFATSGTVHRPFPTIRLGGSDARKLHPIRPTKLQLAAIRHRTKIAQHPTARFLIFRNVSAVTAKPLGHVRTGGSSSPDENSPALQCWVSIPQIVKVPSGTTDVP